MERLDLMKEQSGIRFKAECKKAGNSTAENHGDARKKAEKIADDRLKIITTEAIKLCDQYYKTPFPAIFGPSGDGLYGGNLRQRAINTKQQIVTDKPVAENEIPSVGDRPIRESRDRWFRRLFEKDTAKGLSEQEIRKFAKQAFFSMTQDINFYTVLPKNNENITIYKAVLNSECYDSIKDNNGDFKGLSFKSIEVPNEYKKFVEMFRAGKKKFIKTEADKFELIMEALETQNAFSKKQQKGSASVEKEDVDFFDLSGDGFLNKGDIASMELFLKVGTEQNFKQRISELTKADWDNYTKLKNTSKINNDRILRNTFDLNGDNNVNGQDYELYHQMLKNSDKFDINGDTYVDETDKELLKEYFKAVLQRIKTAEEFREHTIEIIGGKNQVEYLRKKLSTAQ